MSSINAINQPAAPGWLGGACRAAGQWAGALAHGQVRLRLPLALVEPAELARRRRRRLEACGEHLRRQQAALHREIDRLKRQLDDV